MSWFPIFQELLEDQEFRTLTPTDKLYFWHLASNFNLRGEFYQSDLEISMILRTTEKTIRRARAKLIEMRLIEVKPGTHTKRNQFLATRYLRISFANILDEENKYFAQVHRFTFETMLKRLRSSQLMHRDVVVYIYLYYWYWRNRGNREDHQFYITKKHLESLTGLQDGPKRVSRIYEGFEFSNGGHLFEYKEEYHRFIIKNWSTCADPDQNELSLRISEISRKEIKELVTCAKKDKQLRAQQKTMKNYPPIGMPQGDLFDYFQECYKRKYGRLCHYNWKIRAKFNEVEGDYGRGSIFNAINLYFSAEKVPNSSGALTRTMKNFIEHISEILILSAQFPFV
jgi:hypothetical protein